MSSSSPTRPPSPPLPSLRCRGTYLYFSNAAYFGQAITSKHTLLDRIALLLASSLPPATVKEEEREADTLEVRASKMGSSYSRGEVPRCHGSRGVIAPRGGHSLL